MTNREAINIITAKMCLHQAVFGHPIDEPLKTAYEMAIAALEQQGEDNEWCLDCKEYDKEQHCCHRFTKVIRGALDEVKQKGWIPVVHARWIKYTGMGKVQWMCSKCSAEEKNPKVANYCYHCGARMDAYGEE